MKNNEDYLSGLIEFSDALAAKTHFISPEDKMIFEGLKSFYMYAYKKTGEWRNLTKLCALYKKCFKKIPLDVIDIAWEALCSGSHPDAVVYYGIAVVNNLDPELAISKIKDSYSQLKNDDSFNLMKIFEAVIYWKVGEFSKYVRAMNYFVEGKRAEFNPYISIPVSTVWLDESRPEDKEVSDFSFLRKIKTKLPNYKPDYVISVSCDSRYFQQYSEFLFASLSRINDRIYCHVSITDSVDSSGENEIISIVNQNISIEKNIGPVSSALRFLHAFDLLDKIRVPVVVMDFDVVVKSDLGELINKNHGKDMCLRVLNNVLPWEKITAGFGIYYPTDKSIEFLNVVKAFLFNTLQAETSQWWVDQNALECASRFVNDVACENLMPILHKYMFIPTGSYDSKKTQIIRFLDEK